MGTNTLETAYSNGEIIDASHTNELTAAVINQFVGRNTSGVPESGKSLGTAAIPWGAVHANSLVLNGSVVDIGQITSVANRIVSGATRADSDQPQFLDADGTTATMTVQGASTNITLSINATAATVSTDIVKTGLTLAPASNNTVLVDDTELSSDKYAGEIDYIYGATKKRGFITLDTAGPEVVSKVGQIVALKGTTEIMIGLLESATKITNVSRGFFFDDATAPIVREGVSNNDTLTLMNIGWTFVEDNGTTVDISYLTPVWSFDAPSSPATGQYWFDITNQTWKRYSGTEFEIINRIPIGLVVLDDTACIAVRSFDFTNTFSNENNAALEVSTTEIIKSNTLSTRVSVYGTEIIQDFTKLSWNITSDLETGLTEAASTVYYLYLSTKGERIIGAEKPYYRKDIKGFYHPYHTWRCLGEAYNDGSSNLTLVDEIDYNPNIKEKKAIITYDDGDSYSSSWSLISFNAISGDNEAIKLGSNQVDLMAGNWNVKGAMKWYASLNGIRDCAVRVYDVNAAVSYDDQFGFGRSYPISATYGGCQPAEIVFTKRNYQLLTAYKFEFQLKGISSNGSGAATGVDGIQLIRQHIEFTKMSKFA